MKKISKYTNSNVEGVEAVSNHFGSSLKVPISDSFGGYAGLLGYTPPVLFPVSTVE